MSAYIIFEIRIAARKYRECLTSAHMMSMTDVCGLCRDSYVDTNHVWLVVIRETGGSRLNQTNQEKNAGKSVHSDKS